MTISWVAEENPSITAARARYEILNPAAAGSIEDIRTMASMTSIWAKIIQLRLRPRRRVNTGSGRLSTRGAHTNLNEYPRAAQLKNVTTARSIPASRSHRESEEKINSRGSPAENPKNSMVITRGWVNPFTASAQVEALFGRSIIHFMETVPLEYGF